jgi:type IV pilus assembly protein PilY1
MGDTVTAKPNFVRAPIFDYGGTYDAFLVAQANRAARVYVGANDGYLHAFDGDTGVEAWAYTPKFMLKDLYLLADKNYASVHRYFVDGSPEVNDVLDPNPAPNGTWRTLLVGGAGGGGRGYYALDVTDPASPKGLWEWCADNTMCDPTHADTDIGLTYGNPVFGKRSFDGKWVVIFSSGLNNVSPGSTGGGFFFIVDAITGDLLNKVPTNIGTTNVGTTTTPSGLMKIAPFYTNGGRIDATFQYVYGGDQLGNVWRLDVGAATPVVTKLTTLKDGSGRTQPITTHMIPTVVGTDRVLVFATGRYLGSPDLTDQGAGQSAWQQSLYLFKDKVYSAAIQANLRTDTLLVQRQLTLLNATTRDRGISTTPLVNVDWTTNDGWFLDFNPVFGGVQDSPGEGVNLVDPNLIVGNLFVTTTVPATTTGGAQCAAGGISFNYQFDFKQGFPVVGNIAGTPTTVLTVGVAVVQLPSGAIKAIATGSDTSKTPLSINVPASASIVKRFSYRVR